VGFQVNGNTFIDNTGSAIFNANTIVANNFSVQLTPFVSRESTSPMQGTVAGFTAGGNDGSSPPVETNVIDKFPFANELTAVDHSNLTSAKRLVAGQSSDTDGFVTGGLYAPVTPSTLNVIDKFSFSSTSNATDVADISLERRGGSGQSSSTDGYTSGGESPPPGRVNTIDKFPFAISSGTASDVGDLTAVKTSVAGHSSENDGYVSGGSAPGALNVIDKFPFASDTNATDIADLSQARSSVSGQSSKNNGYASGGDAGPAETDTIDKFPFASDTNATDVGNLVDTLNNSSGQNSREHGYVTGGYSAPNQMGMIQKYPFATDTNASDVGSLTVARSQGAGQQD
tara:strand:+ start:1448 stop:2476 length:1029 start_codon:yes stop_codon:yes gene_type:complete